MVYSRIFGMPTFGSLRPYEELTRMRRQMDRIMDSFTGSQALEGGAGVFPATNVTENDDFFFFRAELPGVKAADLDIQATARNLTITGQRTLDVEDENARYHRREREGGRFSRAFALPKEIDADRVEARILNGILTLKVPKAASAKPKRITIES